MGRLQRRKAPLAVLLRRRAKQRRRRALSARTQAGASHGAARGRRPRTKRKEVVHVGSRRRISQQTTKRQRDVQGRDRGAKNHVADLDIGKIERRNESKSEIYLRTNRKTRIETRRGTKNGIKVEKKAAPQSGNKSRRKMLTGKDIGARS